MKLTPLNRAALAVGAGVTTLAVVAGANMLNGPPDPVRPQPATTTTSGRIVGRSEVYDRIASMTDCAALQREFDVAYANHARDAGRGAADLASVDLSYMQAVDARMQDLGCYP